MAASAIAISFDSSDESVGSSPSWVILFGNIPNVIPSTSVIALETSAIAPVILSAAPVVKTTIVSSPTGLCVLVPYSDSDSDSPDEMASPEHYHYRLLMLLPLLIGGAGSPTDSSLVHSSGLGAPDQAHSGSLTRIVSPRLGYPLMRAPRHSEAFHRWCAAPLSTFYLPTTSESSSRDSSERPLHSSSYSVRPSHKRCRSSTDFVPSSTPVMGSLAPTRADLLPPRKRFRDSYSPDTSMEEDTEIDTTKTEDGRELDVVDGDDVRDYIEVDPRDDREEFEASARDTVVLGLIQVEDIPIDLDGAIRDFYHHMSEVCIDRIIWIETTQRQLEADQLIASGERARMTESIESLRLENPKEEFRQIRDDRDDLKRKLGRLESFVERPKALEAYEINKNLGIENRNVNGNGNGNGGNGNDNGGNGNGNGGNGNGQGENRNGDGRGDRPVARQCTYQDFIKCQPLNFKRTKGVVGYDKMRELMKLMTKVYCPRNKIQKIETELWNLTLKNNDLATYTQRFQELTMMYTKMVPEEEDQVDRFIEAKRLCCKECREQEEIGCQSKRQSWSTATIQEIEYERCKLHHEGQCTVTCSSCKRVEHKTRDCKAAIAATTQGTPRNKARIREARGKAYVLRGGDTTIGSNTVTGTFFLNDHHSYMLFDLGVDRSFVSNTFSTLLDITPSALDVSYAVELVSKKTSETSTVLRGYTLRLLGHPFNIDLMPIDLGSFEVIIGMDWLVKNHAVIVCDEKIVRIPYENEILVVQGDKSDEKKSMLSIISCVKAHKYMEKGCQLFLAHVTVKENNEKSKEE
nr:hypothetical protein [Tanacetum cinerariifolium]